MNQNFAALSFAISAIVQRMLKLIPNSVCECKSWFFWVKLTGTCNGGVYGWLVLMTKWRYFLIFYRSNWKFIKSSWWHVGMKWFCWCTKIIVSETDLGVFHWSQQCIRVKLSQNNYCVNVLNNFNHGIQT